MRKNAARLVSGLALLVAGAACGGPSAASVAPQTATSPPLVQTPPTATPPAPTAAAPTATPPAPTPTTSPDARSVPAAPRGTVLTTVTVPASLRDGRFAEERQLQIREGFSIIVVARVPGARSMKMAPWGELLVTQPGQGRIVALRPAASDGAPAEQRTLVERLQCPYGMAFHDGHLYVAQSTRVQRFAYDQRGNLGPAEVVVSGLPQSGCGPHHYRPLEIDPAGNLFVAFGSSCNVCIESDPRRGTVWQYAADGSGREYARGLRNVVDLEFYPGTGQLWGVTNERDLLGDNVPPDSVGPIQEGADYGWPYCYWSGSGWTVDPRVPARNPGCQGLTSYFGIQPHSAPLGLAFASDKQFPPDYAASAFVALHGSWNHSTGVGFKIIRVPVMGGQPQPAEDFITGWFTGGRAPADAWGRPVDLQTAPDGSLFVSDDQAGAVYRVSFAVGG